MDASRESESAVGQADLHNARSSVQQLSGHCRHYSATISTDTLNSASFRVLLSSFSDSSYLYVYGVPGD